jgi:hypothetical protein
MAKTTSPITKKPVLWMLNWPMGRMMPRTYLNALEKSLATSMQNFKAGLPTAVTMAGGYARNIQDTVDIHF